MQANFCHVSKKPRGGAAAGGGSAETRAKKGEKG
jgi:hypothetical protein